MKKLTIVKFFLPFLVIASVFSGPMYNLLLFLNVGIIESHWSLYYNPILFANIMAISFVLFTILFMITTRWIDKILKELYIIIGILIIGFCCIFASLIWVWEIILLVYIVMGIASALLIPMLMSYIANTVREKYESRRRYSLILPLGALFWIAISFVLFTFLGAQWRVFYMITGVINIISSLIFLII
ncbi:MAG: hypothetical protein ACFFE5_07505 [Candidatus Thorarchaeota archaeon]